jgi:acetyltransferase-like isoleucine patch superfamily enzyme
VNTLTAALEKVLSIATLACGRLRALLLALRGARVGAKTALAAGCIVDRPWGVTLGARVVLEADVYLKLVHDKALLGIGDHTFVGRGVEFDLMDQISIGAHSLIAPRCFITDHTHATEAGLRIDQQPCRTAAVVIGSDVWLGAGTIVLPGVTIGNGAVVGANSVVTRDVAPMTVVAGAPATFVRRRDTAGGRS